MHGVGGREARACDGAGVGAGDGHGVVRLLAGRGGDVVVDGRLLAVGVRGGDGGGGGGRGDAHGELGVAGLVLAVGGVEAGVLLALLGRVDAVVDAVVVRVAVRVVQRLGEGHAERALGVSERGGPVLRQPGGVGRRLHAQLGQVQVGAGLVARVHGLVQLALGDEAVHEDAVDGDRDDLDGDLDDGADEGPVLRT